MTTKESVLSALLAAGENKDSFISGEKLSAGCGVSRTSVWKAIQSLERDGYTIEAVTNRGYRLLAVPDVIDADRISSEIAALGVQPGAVHAFSCVDSTLSESKRAESSIVSFRNADGSLTESGKKLHRSLIVAGQQTAGRGRMGRTFVSPANSGVYMTLVFAPKSGVTNPALLTAAAAVAVARAIDALYGTSAQIKWVNDVYIGGKKVCGILTEGFVNFETGRVEAANVGIGINVRPMGFSGNLAHTAASICDMVPGEAAPLISRNTLAAHVAANLLALYDSWDSAGSMTGGNSATGGTIAGYSQLAGGTAAMQAGMSGQAVQDVMAEYRSRSLLQGKTVQINPVAGMPGETYCALVLGVTDEAALEVMLENGEKKVLQSGEVSLHGNDFAL
ncbi:MAG: biotin--[acetyl-CoA-carboxylase] ligase [Treponema sp.]|nr:biotin--[acetyl-CoA-carboxylase] ligase [Treponema sp.]